MKIKVVLFFILGGIVTHPSYAQDASCTAEQFFETNQGCLGTNRGSKCLQLDVSHSLDKQGKEFVYSWNFGDGNSQEGLLTEYCFAEYGSYFITLDLVDAKTKMVIRNELSTTVTLWPSVNYQVDTLIQHIANFEYNNDEFPGFTARDIYWRIEDEFYCGPTVRHTFKKDGFHLIEIGMVGDSEERQNQTGCTLMGVFIKPTQ
ncbi:MAG: PKD domain-containing protein [Cyclobacteriaceae bacterium]